MRIQAQNTNFGAIKIKGLKANSEASKEVYLIAKEDGVKIDSGKTFWGTSPKYIRTDFDSYKEIITLKALKEGLKGHKGVSVKQCSIEEANINIDRAKKTGMNLCDWLFG